MHSHSLLTFPTCIPMVLAVSLAWAAQTGEVRTGSAALADWKADGPGVRRYIKPSDLPAPPTDRRCKSLFARVAKLVPPPQGALPRGPGRFRGAGFRHRFQDAVFPALRGVAPNGDIFLSESGAGRVLVFRAEARDGRDCKAGGVTQRTSTVLTVSFSSQPRSAALSVAFYDRDAFPAEYRGDAFVALHGSHSTPESTGYKVIRVWG